MKEQEKMIARLYCKLRRALHTYAARYCPDEAEDIVQEAMLKLWLVRDRIDREKNISPMGMTVTRNLCIDRLR